MESIVENITPRKTPAIPDSKRNGNNGGGRRPWYEDPTLTEKYSAFQMLRGQGVQPEKAAEMLGYRPSTGWILENKIKERLTDGMEIAPFVTVKRQKAAAGVVDKLMKGQTFGKIKEIKDSTALRAAETVLDRSHPKRSESESGPSLSFVTINLGMMAQGGADPPMLDVSPILENGPSNPPGVISDGDGI